MNELNEKSFKTSEEYVLAELIRTKEEVKHLLSLRENDAIYYNDELSNLYNINDELMTENKLFKKFLSKLASSVDSSEVITFGLLWKTDDPEMYNFFKKCVESETEESSHDEE